MLQRLFRTFYKADHRSIGELQQFVKSIDTTIRQPNFCRQLNFVRNNSTNVQQPHTRDGSDIPKRQTYMEEEVKKFSSMAESWWDPEGFCKPLHSMNDLRVPLVRDGLIHTKVANEDQVSGPKPLLGVRILDVGCGGGILCEPLARLGAEVTGIDASIESIQAAELHAQKYPSVLSNVRYIHGTVEDHAEGLDYQYDAVIASEVLEHVADTQFFIDTCASLIKPKGSFFISTINKTPASWLGAIVAAEYILNLLPRETHDWNKFVPIEDLRTMLESNNLNTRLIHGMLYVPVIDKWKWTSNSSVSYAVHAVKES